LKRIAISCLVLVICVLVVLAMVERQSARRSSARDEDRDSIAERARQLSLVDQAVRPDLTAPARIGDASGDALAEGVRGRTLADDAHDVRGTVLLPPGMAPDEVVLVVAVVEGAGFGERSVRVAEDGRFALSLPPEAAAARLDIRSRMLCLAEPLHVTPGARGVVLQPHWRAVVTGELVWPRAIESWANLRVMWTPDPRTDSRDEALPSRCFAPRLAIPKAGRFELQLLPVGLDLELSVTNPLGAPTVFSVAALAPGEHQSVRIVLETGVTVSGSVVDERGKPVAGVRLAVRAANAERHSADLRRSVLTDDDGGFVLRQLPRTLLHVTAEGSNLVRGADADVDGSLGDVQDVVLTVVRGGFIGGTVTWPDGTPAEEFEVSARGPLADYEHGEAGTFTMHRLPAGRYRVEVRAAREGMIGTASVDGVEPGSTLRLVLEPRVAFAVEGTAVDAEGAPLPEFRVFAASETGWRSSDGAGGHFRFAALEPGHWSISAYAPGFQRAHARIDVGATSEPLRFVLHPSGRIRGIVRSPAGDPMPGASVGPVSTMSKSIGLAGETTDASGAFEVEGSAPEMVIAAFADGFAPSAPVHLQVAPGETVDEIVLVLREACRAAVCVLAEDGRPAPFVSVRATEPDSLTAMASHETNARGELVLDFLPPGRVRFFTSLPDGSQSATTVAELVPGRRTDVQLRLVRREDR
jgi:hypothetical protein